MEVIHYLYGSDSLLIHYGSDSYGSDSLFMHGSD